MKEFNFDPFTNRSLIFTFSCNNCDSIVTTKEISIPSLDYFESDLYERVTKEFAAKSCDHCAKMFDIEINVSIGGGKGFIKQLEENASLEVQEIPDSFYQEQLKSIESNTHFYKTFTDEVRNLGELNKITLEDDSIAKTLRRQIFIGVIASMETYLSDAFINTTLSSKELLRNFVSSFHNFNNKSIPFKEIFNHFEQLESFCKREMLNVIYHHLDKVRGMFKDTLKVDIGDIEIPSKYVSVRHDLVHRNGKTKENVEIIIDVSTIDNLILDIQNFIKRIDDQIDAMRIGEFNWE